MIRILHTIKLMRLTVIAALALALFAVAGRAQADVSNLVLGSRSCGTVTGYIHYDNFSEGNPPFYAVFAVDLNGNGVYGEAGEPLQYIIVGPGGSAGTVTGFLTFGAVPAGSTISVTAYEIDSVGTIVSPQLPAVSYVCSHRPATNPYPSNTAPAVPTLAVSAKITAYAVQIYDIPDAVNGNAIAGLPRGAVVNVLGRNNRGDWLQIQYGGGTGWIMWETNAILFGPYQQLSVTS